ncbi:hypothetical protein [Enhygromyxa salina]|uniref:Lipoprotein n=1 Tax=Enhygromyxa salina TaxID=215803 RepID=A0A2S9YVE3_9BACT|nr:hypothetical protein [Enhygromyxa salina]PRQ09068.1 hypothetical protein ENSA7_10580 [Enhygromyxa salina]
MLTKTMLMAFLAACGVSSNPATSPNEKQPPEEDVQEDQHFCCASVDLENFTGEGCTAISKETINACSNVLYCPEMWAKSEGKVACE